MTAAGGHWGLAPGHEAPVVQDPAGAAGAGAAGDSSRPVRLIALCDLGPRSSDPAQASVGVDEHLELASGRRVVLHAGERGWTSGYVGPAPRPAWTEAEIVQGALLVVLPDGDDDPEPHPWAWLAELARARGVEVTADDLRALPYDVELTDRLRAWVGGRA